MDSIRNRDFEKEITIIATRSSGPGGQNVNKVSSRVELRFNVMASSVLTDEEKAVISEKLKNRINKEGELILSSQEDRSQLRNRDLVLERFYTLLEQALKPVKKRRPTKPTAASKQKRSEEKRTLSEKKKLRKPPENF